MNDALLSPPAVAPADQARRILMLRLSFLAIVPLVLFTRSAWMDAHWLFDTLEVLGIFLIIAGVLGRLWSILYIGGRKNLEIVQDGPYSICRHPLYLFSTLGVLGFGLMLGSVVMTALLGMLFFTIINRTASREEAYLRHSLGTDYDDYAARVPRILPRLAGFRTAPQVTFDVAVLRRNLFDALVFLSLIPLAELMEVLKEAGGFPTLALF
ncbi:isoprenylcysteine carboxylmethyltransferase family protein [Lutimaribacter sp. EGI FJ00015]|uniref:Isoprenylcysteine carboxylmethyltransferase family protein n=1 Tax=Lutimaribacter degradans TaxID=2945989 RepID=A0ACC5ZWD6_9RHOB|nr:isoprenylcysteine carboxylmethyltransferase family protein [Lutimaribacter sp. EGI FJ00013]MCM2562510.1 isoprenylcysteine carboxylmethyltransferase family protein [Lutimaribacter sp. EGI FJ00013]MCO0613667.1 isoprenylcysteine carboxylmethyltransferase family protein [Lutimaribacter sp. EGI FJ00015]MCO0636850.1 isoprenylcysteine carboxylmethyltransferase family protein [Lutimaribacter sp. EGI FJ00014]